MEKEWYTTWNVDKSWTLFLDRDGVINKKLPEAYVQHWEEFEFLPGVKTTLAELSKLFGRIVLVTNQQGIGKGIMTHDDLTLVHKNMLQEIELAGGRMDALYYCAELAQDLPHNRKPNTGMPEQAKSDFPEIDFAKSIIVGDSESDMEMGRRLGMKRVFIAREPERLPLGLEIADYWVVQLPEWLT